MHRAKATGLFVLTSFRCDNDRNIAVPEFGPGFYTFPVVPNICLAFAIVIESNTLGKYGRSGGCPRFYG